MFLHLSVSHSVHRGGGVYTPLGRHTHHPPDRHPLGRSPPWQIPPLGTHSPYPLGRHPPGRQPLPGQTPPGRFFVQMGLHPILPDKRTEIV